MRRAARVTLVMVVLALWAIAGPLAVVFAGCPGMGAMCEGPCGIQACALSPVVGMATVQPSGPAPVLALPPVPLFVPSGLEPPPKPVRFSA